MEETKTKKYAVAIVHDGYRFWVDEHNKTGMWGDSKYFIYNPGVAERIYKLQIHILNNEGVIELREYDDSEHWGDYIVLRANKSALDRIEEANMKETETVKNENVIKEIASKVWWAIRGILKLVLAVAMVPVLLAIMGSHDAKNRRN